MANCQIDYVKLDTLIKKNPDAKFLEFIKLYPKFKVSAWSYTKRRATILGLPLTPSMSDDYRQARRANTAPSERRSRSVYTTALSIPVDELKGKTGLEVLNLFIDSIANKTFKLNLESVQVEPLGSGVKTIEIRRYSK